MSPQSSTNALLSPPPSTSVSLHTLPTTSPSTFPHPNQKDAPGVPDASPPRPKDFQPFFTLIADLSSTETDTETATHHPSKIHYLFTDDEDASEVISSACLRSLNFASSVRFSRLENSEPHRESSVDGRERRASGGGRKGVRKQERSEAEERDERVLIIDIHPTGSKITKAQSLSPNWQVLSAELSGAPMWDGLGERGRSGGEGSSKKNEGNGSGRGLMLRVEGVGRDMMSFVLSVDGENAGVGQELDIRDTAGSSAGSEKEREREKRSMLADEEMQALLKDFDRKMGVLRSIAVVEGLEALEGEREGEGMGKG